MILAARNGGATVLPLGGWLSDGLKKLGDGIQKSVIDPLKQGVSSAGEVIQSAVIDPIAEGFQSAGDQLHEIEKANRAALQRLAPCAVGVGLTYMTGGATSSMAAALCIPALIPGAPPEMVSLDDPRAQEYAATHPTTIEPGDPGLFGIPGLPAPTRSNAVLYGAAAIGLLLLLRSLK